MERRVDNTPIIYTYYIRCHGIIVTDVIVTDDDEFTDLTTTIPEIKRINLPDKVEILTYTTLGEGALTSCSTLNYVCKKDSPNDRWAAIQTPVAKYTRGFPELFLHADDPGERRVRSLFSYFISSKVPIPLAFYSGIVHCNTENSNDKKEIIHNMDADPARRCRHSSVRTRYDDSRIGRTQASSNTDIRYKARDYMEYYRGVLETPGRTRKPPLGNINKCGQLFLS